MRNGITSEIRKSKRAYFSRLTDLKNGKTFFHTLKIDKKETREDVDLDADHLNDYFVTIGEKILSEIS